jgi:predicted aspartyl protease
METEAMGGVLTEATIENVGDLWNVQQGQLSPDQVRRITVPDALVDTGATLLSLPARMIRSLGLTKVGEKRVTSSLGLGNVNVYAAVRLTIQGRFCTTDVLEVPDDAPMLVGQLPLENLDFVIDPRSHRLIGNPAHGGEHMFELY